MVDTSATMEVKAKIDAIVHSDIQDCSTEQTPHEGTEMEIMPVEKVENNATQETMANMENINVTVETISKEEMEANLIDDILEQLPENANDKKQMSSEESIDLGNEQMNNRVQKTTETALETSVTPQATKVTNDESKRSFQLVNPLKRKRCRPQKRRHKRKIHQVMTDKVAEGVTESEDTSMEVCKDDVEYCLTVSNLPNSWSFMDIKNYIDTECGPVDEIEMIKDDKTSNGAIRLSYQTEDECKMAKEKLKDKEIAGNKLVLEIMVVSLESSPEVQAETPEASNMPWKPDMDSWELDLHGMYGLKLQYLRSLGITPPLDKWVHVSNFRCDKSELRDVMEMAGNVQMCSVFTVSPRYANVMYSHPLEAVQAVSMLNNQLFYGQPLKVTMDRSPVNTVLLPKGLTNIGQGLGLHGKPLRNIVKHYERFVENKDCLINPVIFDVPANHAMKLSGGSDAVKFHVKSVEEFNYPIAEDKGAVSKAVTTKAVTPVQSVAAPKPNPPKPPVLQTAAYTLPQPKPVSAPPAANFSPSFPHGPFPANFRPFGQPINGQGMPPPQGPPVPIGPQMMPPGPHRPSHPGLVGPPRPQHPGLVAPPRPQHPGLVAPTRPQHPGYVALPRPQHPGLVGPSQPPQFVHPFPGPQAAWGPAPRPLMAGPRPVPPGPMLPNEPVKLILSNLPPSTTFALLCEKMSEWGHVVCIQLTTPGCAVVTFANRMQADACLQHFNGRNIENYLVQAKYA